MSARAGRPEVEDLRWLSIDEARRLIGVSARTLYRLIDEDKIAAFRMGRVIRLQEGDVRAFIESVRVQPGSLAKLYPKSVASKRTKAEREAAS